jgi:hypothetical protein
VIHNHLLDPRASEPRGTHTHTQIDGVDSWLAAARRDRKGPKSGSADFAMKAKLQELKRAKKNVRGGGGVCVEGVDAGCADLSLMLPTVRTNSGSLIASPLCVRVHSSGAHKAASQAGAAAGEGLHLHG